MGELDSYLVSDEAARQTESAAGRVLSPGAAIGAFRVVAFLGRGATSEVYRVRDDALKADFALKIFALDESCGRERERFIAEARLLAQFQSPHVVRVHGLSDVGAHPYFTMDLLRPLPDAPSRRQAEQVLSGVLDALEELHSKGIIHRDIKPSNILLDGNGHAVVTDLGIAHVSDDAPERMSAAMPRNMTIADGKAVAIGTPGYGAPEQFSCGDVSPATDIHAVGMTLLALFNGHPPFFWRGLIRRMTSSAPSLRYSSVKAVRRAVRRMRFWRSAAMAASAIATASLLISVFGIFAVEPAWQELDSSMSLHKTQRDEKGNVTNEVKVITLRDGGHYVLPETHYPRNIYEDIRHIAWEPYDGKKQGKWLMLSPDGKKQGWALRSKLEIRGYGVLKCRDIIGAQVKVCSGVTLVTSGVRHYRKNIEPLPQNAQKDDPAYFDHPTYIVEPGGKLIFTDTDSYPQGLIEYLK